jgi:tRNA pseudouridine55 synthase
MTRELQDYVLPVDKPVGPTSHDIVYQARRALRTKRVGHTGTLDPFASGLLLLCINGATRIAEYLTGFDKSYEATARLDGMTDTDDSTGQRMSESTSWQSRTEQQIEAAAASLVGAYEQRPPRYSAKQKEGQRAYEVARRGGELELEPVLVEVRRLRITRIDLPEVDFELDCSSGTYVRAIARDLGEQLGTGGYLSALRRTRVGDFLVDTAITVDALTDAPAVQQRAVSILAALAHVPRIEVSTDIAQRIRHGQRIAGDYPVADPAIIVCGDEVVALGRSDGYVLRPTKVWSDA